MCCSGSAVARRLRMVHADHWVNIDPTKSVLRVLWDEGRAIVPVNEGQLVAYVGWLAIEREAGRRSVSAAYLPQYI
jgi:hypothetical protein